MFKTLSSSLLAARMALATTAIVPDTAFAAGWFDCVPTSVVKVNGPAQIQVTCSNSFTVLGTAYTNFAIAQTGTGAPSDSDQNRLLSMATSALLSGKKFRIFVTDAACHAAFTNCRLFDAWGLKR